VELHALTGPRPLLVPGVTADLPERRPALSHAIGVNKLVGYQNRAAHDLHPQRDHPLAPGRFHSLLPPPPLPDPANGRETAALPVSS